MNSLEGIRRAALEGMGIAYLPSWMVMEHLGGPGSRLQPVLSAHAAPPTPLNAVYSAERLPHRASVFIDFVAEVLAATPGLAMR
jgi:DNA-binding transcriptional LysR family regulator